jgi:hypothetical protein
MTSVSSADRGWLGAELDDCIDSWRAVSETEGPNSQDALLWKGRADQALRSAIHFGMVSPEEGRRRMATLTPGPGTLRAFMEPDGEGEE